MILVTGAAGHLGTAVINNLLKQIPSNEIAAFIRNEKAVPSLNSKGIKTHIGDYSDKDSLDKAFQNIDKLLLITSNGKNALQEHINVVNAAKKAGVKHIYYTGGALNKNVKESKLGSLSDSYITTENYIIESGLTYTIFQNALYTEIIPYFIGYEAIETGICFPAGNGKASFGLRSEMGEAIANVIVSKGHANSIYILTALPSYSFGEIAELLSEISGKEVLYHDIDPQKYEIQLREYGVNEGDIGFSTLFAAIIENDEYDIGVSDLERLLGRKPSSLKNYLIETYIEKY
ncbi:MAG TPA: NmrA family NAD(P)-binding protein [Chryseobacterium sp.]